MRLPRREAAVVITILAVGTGMLAGCGGGDSGGETTAAGTATTTAPEGIGDATAGATVWEQANCGGCHTLEAAGSDGAVGPNLDDLKPDVTTVVTQVTNGGGGMPSFKDQLSEQQIADVSAYVVQSTTE